MHLSNICEMYIFIDKLSPLCHNNCKYKLLKQMIEGYDWEINYLLKDYELN